jgi:hypothetical protein
VSLHFVLKVNEQPIGVCIIRCLNADRGVPDPDAVYDYEVRVESLATLEPGQHVTGTVQHRYGDGAWKLVHAALDQVLREPTVVTR